jgi:hypothetical protein
MNLAYYTCFIGTDNNNNAFAIPEIPSTQHDCYYFTNNHTMIQKLQNTKWKIVFVDFQSTDDIIENNMMEKHVKTR